MDPETSDNDGSYRFSPVTFNDHAGQLWIVTILSLIYSTLAALARLYIKYHKFGFDDFFFALAMIFHLAQSIAVFIGLSKGLGKFNSITAPEQWATSSKVSLVRYYYYYHQLTRPLPVNSSGRDSLPSNS
ncbi:hypothetical protein Forpe1208_v009703 [Fusarium oxysporum f. sp. rapae]|uniref:Uncharacterized protein n=1 Tax=Fusarium oxysporum f. sp. rapae TaxID=485398 RepID=A0A8J5NS78_FUSOX|nr:hypothetical protein Forpe1208_v009703 [Fusarium oxysporum f. sp. rapae]